jgi:hypothetical protein
VVDSASNRNEYQEYFLGSKGGRCVGLTTFKPIQAYNGVALTFTFIAVCPVLIRF